MGDAGRQTVKARFDWPVVARLHHQLYAELSDRRSNGQGIAGMGDLHPLRETLSATSPLLRQHLLGQKLFCDWLCPCLSCRTALIILRT